MMMMRRIGGSNIAKPSATRVSFIQYNNIMGVRSFSDGQYTKLFVANFPYSTTEEELQDHFRNFGFNVNSIELKRDRQTDRPRGFGFIEIESGLADNVIEQCHEKDFNGRNLVVSIAKERAPRPEGGFRRRSFNNDE